ncbi:MAG: class I SAM-dependent methyltransferase [Sulfuritalea sp.]|nr:class I SAM-dependent methyltransferase [Sulfuritalea sp.]
MSEHKRRMEFGDFQTPDGLALAVCRRLAVLGMRPDVVIEPTCGVGAFVRAAAEAFPDAREILGFETNAAYLDTLRAKFASTQNPHRIRLEHADFFTTDWRAKLSGIRGSVLVVGNFPWVTNAALGTIGGSNLPEKSNFLAHRGFDAISGKANFDISEWMLLEVLRWFEGRSGDVAMLVKTAVARKILAHAQRQGAMVRDAFSIGINAKQEFGAAVDACLLVMRFTTDRSLVCHDYTIFSDLDDKLGRRVGHRLGLTVGDLDAFEASAHLIGASPQKWRSGVKHDASAVMEFTRSERGLENGLGEIVELEPDYLYPLLKGSDVGSAKAWRGKFVLVTQHRVGEATELIRTLAPLTWAYLERHGAQLDARGSTIYAKNPRFSVFGVGDYAFYPWKIAICGLYKLLRFRLVGPIDGRPVMFDDTVYQLSFETEAEAMATLAMIDSEPARSLLSSLIFWDEKRPVKTSILNVLDWSKLAGVECRQPALF